MKKAKQPAKENKPAGDNGSKVAAPESGLDIDLIPDKDIGRGLPPRANNTS